MMGWDCVLWGRGGVNGGVDSVDECLFVCVKRLWNLREGSIALGAGGKWLM